VRSRSGVKQGCPISPLLFIIIFDLLIEVLKAEEGVVRVFGYMDDLAVTVKDPQTINKLISTFKLYCEATGAQLNYDKCYVLVTEEFRLEEEFKEMPEANYAGHRVMYLGVPVSLKVKPSEDWKKIVGKMEKVAMRIKRSGAGHEIRIRMINTSMVSLMGHLGRFTIKKGSQALSHYWILDFSRSRENWSSISWRDLRRLNSFSFSHSF
jgi:Reverse transcriptase (RNA-dependent DNA polymerase)